LGDYNLLEIFWQAGANSKNFLPKQTRKKVFSLFSLTMILFYYKNRKIKRQFYLYYDNKKINKKGSIFSSLNSDILCLFTVVNWGG
jgi:hypothetical protein